MKKNYIKFQLHFNYRVFSLINTLSARLDPVRFMLSRFRFQNQELCGPKNANVAAAVVFKCRGVASHKFRLTGLLEIREFEMSSLRVKLLAF